MNKKVFPLTSRLVFSPTLMGKIPEQELMEAFARHDSGDWGIVSKATSKQNCSSLIRGGELVSEYQARNGVRFRIITTQDSRITRFESFK